MQRERAKHSEEMRLVASLTSKRDRSFFVKEVMKMPGGENILDCIQCGMCAGSCPTRFAMDYSPMQIIKMVHLGMRERVLSSSTIWICSTCYTCYTRCPRAINLTTIMTSLKNLAMRENFVDKNGVKPKFHRSFFEIVNKYGRMHEPELFTRILKKSDLRSLFHNAALGWRLWRKGKLQIRAPKIEQSTDLLNILERTSEEES
ncbi:MAG: 4Fe-4S dicluster domain-containing protein [Candidatus Bathyarchaeia archaeon]